VYVSLLRLRCVISYQSLKAIDYYKGTQASFDKFEEKVAILACRRDNRFSQFIYFMLRKVEGMRGMCTAELLTWNWS
jgi:hypothetical protein